MTYCQQDTLYQLGMLQLECARFLSHSIPRKQGSLCDIGGSISYDVFNTAGPLRTMTTTNATIFTVIKDKRISKRTAERFL
mmetsp:Transcript_35196/g.59750  ORF Transcript_35196/g.59750 Transcript_35196/m.59750 type:complete len:81 (-) Transcript_35196:135-377(-)